jgi:hypothetical protein
MNAVRVELCMYDSSGLILLRNRLHGLRVVLLFQIPRFVLLWVSCADSNDFCRKLQLPELEFR